MWKFSVHATLCIAGVSLISIAFINRVMAEACDADKCHEFTTVIRNPDNVNGNKRCRHWAESQAQMSTSYRHDDKQGDKRQSDTEAMKITHYLEATGQGKPCNTCDDACSGRTDNDSRKGSNMDTTECQSQEHTKYDCVYNE
jgi:hypothetical protein